jgi:hypothetical protein
VRLVARVQPDRRRAQAASSSSSRGRSRRWSRSQRTAGRWC